MCLGIAPRVVLWLPCACSCDALMAQHLPSTVVLNVCICLLQLPRFGQVASTLLTLACRQAAVCQVKYWYSCLVGLSTVIHKKHNGIHLLRHALRLLLWVRWEARHGCNFWWYSPASH